MNPKEIDSLSSDLQQYIASLESTQKIAETVYQCLDRDTLIETALDAIMKFTQFDGVAMYLLSDDLSELILHSHRGVDKDTVEKGLRIPVKESLSGKALNSGDLLYTGDFHSDDASYAPVKNAIAAIGMTSAACVPLIFDEQPLGIINVLFKQLAHPLNEHDFSTMRTIGKMVSAALSNAIYVDRIHQEVSAKQAAQQALVKTNEILEDAVAKRTQKLEEALNHVQSAQTRLVESEKMAALGGLVAGIAHEINTPLGVSKTASSLVESNAQELISAFEAEALTMEMFEEKIREIKETSLILERNIDRAAGLVKSFKQVAVEQSDERIWNFDVMETINSAITTLSPKWKRAHVTFDVTGPESLIMHSYAGALSQVVTNLIINSIIHGFEHQDNGKISITVEQTDHLCHITYQDNGKGIGDLDPKQLFEPFFTTKRGQGGSGLGMHILYNLISHRMGGRIEVLTTPPGLGFNIYLPLDAEAPSAV